MNLRSRLMLGSLVVILALSGVYLVLSLTATDTVFTNYEDHVQKKSTEQIQGLFASFYVKNGGKWDGVAKILPNTWPGRERLSGKLQLVLWDEKGLLVVVYPRSAQESWQERWQEAEHDWQGTKVPIIVQEKQVGTLWFYGKSPIEIDGIRSRVFISLIKTLLISLLISSAVAFGISYLMANRITKPLMGLAEAVQKVGQRQFGFHLPVTSKDEVGVVIQAFNEMSRELERNEKVRRNLVADVAHELRTPLTVIQGQLESIQQGVTPASVETILPIQDEVIRLKRLVDDLRQLTLAEAGRLELRRVPTDLAKLVQKVVDHFQWEAEGKEVVIKTAFPLQAELLVDPDRIIQIIVNILGNALRYSPAGKVVEIGIQQSDQQMENRDLEQWIHFWGAKGSDSLPFLNRQDPAGFLLWVADQGPGISPEQIPFVFDRFYRGDESRERGTGGAGLGLAIAKEFVLAHGGKIAAGNSSSGGSVFAIFLPLTKS